MQQLPETTVNRLPVYLRALASARADGLTVVSSQAIAARARTNAAQVRRDLSYLGELGTRGLGYGVEALADHITRALGLTVPRRVAIIGYGRLGGALLRYLRDPERGFRVVAVVDSDPAKTGSRVGGLMISSDADLDRALRESRAEIAVITTPAAVASGIADRVCEAGVKAILNFAPVSLTVPDDVKVRQVDLTVGMQVLSYHLEHGATTPVA